MYSHRKKLSILVWLVILSLLVVSSAAADG